MVKEKLYKITDKEVVKALNNFEMNEYYHTGVRKHSGGFCEAEIYNYDDEYFDIELKWGIQNDCENTTHTENYKMDRSTLEIECA